MKTKIMESLSVKSFYMTIKYNAINNAINYNVIKYRQPINTSKNALTS